MAEPQRITASDAQRRLDRGDHITFVDTRADEAWRKAETQIPGSIRVPPDDVEDHLRDLPRKGLLVTYCT